MKIGFFFVFMVLALSNTSQAFEIIELGERQCSTNSNSVFLAKGGQWKKFKDRIVISQGTTIEKAISDNSKNPHVVLVQALAQDASVTVGLTRREFREVCTPFFKRLFGRNPNRDDFDNVKVPKAAYNSFLKDGSLSSSAVNKIREFNFYFRDAGRCVNTAKFHDSFEFRPGDIDMAKGFKSNLGDHGKAVANPAVSREIQAAALIPASSHRSDNACVYVKLRSTVRGIEQFSLIINELGADER